MSSDAGSSRVATGVDSSSPRRLASAYTESDETNV
jgi:hypothetical protein